MQFIEQVFCYTSMALFSSHFFVTLKQAFTSAPIFVHWDPDSPLIVETDASDHTLAAILSIWLDGNIVMLPANLP